MVELPARVVVVPVVNLGAHAERQQLTHNFLRLLNDLRSFFLAGDRHHDDLGRRHAWRQDEAFVVTVPHDHHSDAPGGQSPRVLPGELLLSLLVLEPNIEHLAEVLPQTVRGRALDSSSVGRDEALDGRRVVAAGELLELTLLAFDDRDRQEVFVDLGVEVEDLPDLDCGLLQGRVGGVAFLPEELAGPEEGGRVLELPPDDVAPLVELEGQVPVAPDPLGEGRVHDGLRGRPDGDGDLEVRGAGLGDPGDLWGEAFDVALLGAQGLLADEHREVGVFDPQPLDVSVELLLDLLPDRVGPRAQDVAARDVVVLDQVALGDDLRVPAAEVLFLLDRDAQHVDLGRGFYFLDLFFDLLAEVDDLVGFADLVEELEQVRGGQRGGGRVDHRVEDHFV